MSVQLVGETQRLTILDSASRTTTQTKDLKNTSSRGLHLIIDVTVAGTGSITAKVDGIGADGVVYNLITGAAITTVSTTVLKLYPGLTAVLNSVVSDVLPYDFRVTITANNANAMTYSVGVNLLK